MARAGIQSVRSSPEKLKTASRVFSARAAADPQDGRVAVVDDRDLRAGVEDLLRATDGLERAERGEDARLHRARLVGPVDERQSKRPRWM